MGRLSAKPTWKSRHRKTLSHPPERQIPTPPPLTPDVSGDNAFLALLDRNAFEIGKTAHSLNLNRNTITERFKGLCLKAMAENDWEVNLAARSITQNDGNLQLVETKISEYYNNTLEELHNYASAEDLDRQVGKKFKNTPKKFHQFIIRMYDEIIMVSK